MIFLSTAPSLDEVTDAVYIAVVYGKDTNIACMHRPHFRNARNTSQKKRSLDATNHHVAQLDSTLFTIWLLIVSWNGDHGQVTFGHMIFTQKRWEDEEGNAYQAQNEDDCRDLWADLGLHAH